MKGFSKIGLTTLGALLVLIGVAAAQAPRGAHSDADGSAPLRAFPPPTNLKVLPKDLTGQQVHDLMKQWSNALGVHCDACHLRDTESTGLDGKPHLSFADDAKPMKAVARLMYTMTEEVNVNYIAKVNGSGMPVNCGTCHRGVVNPAPFASAEESPDPEQAKPGTNKGRSSK